MSQRDRVLKNVAIALASTAFAVVSIVAIVVATRSTPAQAEAPHVVQELPPRDITVAVADVVALGRDGATEAIGGGVRVIDAPLAKRLGLGDDDVITSISGRDLSISRDVNEALIEVSILKAKTLYIELLRDHGPGLVRWRIDGDLRSARHNMPPSPSPSWAAGLTPPPTPPDPLLDTIRTLDDSHADMPEATARMLIADPAKALGRSRIVPAFSTTAQQQGYRLYVIRPGSLLARLNFKNGDTVQTINGKDISSPSASIEAYRELHTAKQLSVGIVRRGMLLTLEITID